MLLLLFWDAEDLDLGEVWEFVGTFEFEFWREELEGGRFESESVFESDSVPELGGVTLSAGVGLVENGSGEESDGEGRVPLTA